MKNESIDSCLPSCYLVKYNFYLLNREFEMNNDLIELALKTLKCTQKQLAERLAVSPTQVSKWKKGGYMSYDMQDKISDLLGLDGLEAKVVLMSGSVTEAKQWKKLIEVLAERALEQCETGYDTLPLADDLGFLPFNTFCTLEGMGVSMPTSFPLDLLKPIEVMADLTNEDYSEEDYEKASIAIEDNPYASLIYQIFQSLNNIYGFYVAYIEELSVYDDEDDRLLELDVEIESYLLDLAACKLDIDESLAKHFFSFRMKVKKDYDKWLNQLKLYCFRANIPLRAELLDLVYSSSSELGLDAERQALGLNSDNLHPDIYMNELLVGMRMIHQVLPAILKKLEIYDEFEIDQQSLRQRPD